MTDETAAAEEVAQPAAADITFVYDGPGLYDEMSNEEYQAVEAESKSRLDTISDEAEGSPLHYWNRYIRPDRPPEKKTEALILGDAIHKAILEPDLVDKHFFTAPADAPKNPDSRSRKAAKPSQGTLDGIAYWDDLFELNKGKLLLKPDQMDLVIRSRDAVWRDPTARGLLTGCAVEQSYFAIDPITGLLVKCRHDANKLDAGLACDVKSTLSAHPGSFSKSIDNYRYHVQHPWYLWVPELHYGGPAFEHFAFICVEKDEPNPVEVYYLDPEDIETGRKAMRKDLDMIARCRDAGVWPSYTGGNGATQISRPDWAKRRDPA